MDSTPTLYLFPVPMGATPPAQVLPKSNLDILAEVKHFIVENVRSARRFIRACSSTIDIDSLSFVELNRHTPVEEISRMLQPMEQGYSMGVISEAGCPAVADPGSDVVAIAQKRGYKVCPLVGPSSIIMSLMGSGFNGQNFAFVGYLPIAPDQRAAAVKELERRIRRDKQTQIFIETPYRNNKLIAWLCSNLPAEMLLCVASDITGPNQSITTMNIGKWKTHKYDYDKIPTIFLLYQ